MFFFLFRAHEGIALTVEMYHLSSLLLCLHLSQTERHHLHTPNLPPPPLSQVSILLILRWTALPELAALLAPVSLELLRVQSQRLTVPQSLPEGKICLLRRTNFNGRGMTVLQVQVNGSH